MSCKDDKTTYLQIMKRINWAVLEKLKKGCGVCRSNVNLIDGLDILNFGVVGDEIKEKIYRK